MFFPVGMEMFAGVYHSSELETSYRILLKNDSLQFEFVPGMTLPMRAVGENKFQFEYAGLNTIEFTDSGFNFSREGVRNLWFGRLSR